MKTDSSYIRLSFLALAAPILIVLAISFSSLATNPLTAQNESSITLLGSGGGEFETDPDHPPHLTDQQRQEIWTAIQTNVTRLQAQNRLPNQSVEQQISLHWPLQLAAGLDDFGYHGISNFVDQDPSYPNQLLDYSCGARTYDTSSGYNHQGIDYFTWPFGWSKMDNDEVEIVAAAPGVIVHKQDGNYDRSCSFGGTWNAVYVRHADGSTAWYGHMKNGSTTSKGVGATVVQGERLGIVGSSGSSTEPHLHFELYDVNDNLIDPYAGTCNTLNNDSWWADQRNYYDSAVNKITTGNAAPQFPSCPNPEVSNEEQYFDPGDTIYFTTYYRDQLSVQTSQYKIYAPNGSVYSSWSHNSNATHYASSWWYWYFSFSNSAPKGTWLFEVTYNGESYQHPFYVGDPNIGISPSSLTSGQAPDQQQVKTITVGNVGEVPLAWSVTEDETAVCATTNPIAWAATTPTNNLTNANANSDITVTFDATGLATGTYQGKLCVQSNDPDTPLVQVPITLEVCAPPNEPSITSISSNGSTNTIQWTGLATKHFELWHSSDNPYFEPTGDCETAVNNCTLIDTPPNSYTHNVTSSNNTYFLRAADTCSNDAVTSAASNRQALFTFTIMPGS